MDSNTLQLPQLNEAHTTERVSNLNDYRHWEQIKKKSYRAELDREVEQHRRSRQKSMEDKGKERIGLSVLIEEERALLASSKYAKIKTEQQYRQEN